MSDRKPNTYSSKRGIGRGRGRGAQSSQGPPRTTASNTYSRPETPPQLDDDFPTLEAARLMRTPAPVPPHPSTTNTVQTTASNMYTIQPVTAHQGHPQVRYINPTHYVQPLMPSVQSPLQPVMVVRPLVQQPFGEQRVNRARNNIRNVAPPRAMAPPVTTNDNTASEAGKAAATAPPPPILNRWENEVAEKLYEIMLQLHLSKQHVSLEEVEKRLFQHFRVPSWRELRVHPMKFGALTNHNDRLKNINLYLHVFQQVFHICTLKDFELYLLKFMEVDSYDALRLGPLDKHPEVQKVFKYKPLAANQPIPDITTGEIIERFMEFLKKHRHQKQTPLEEFLDDLVKVYEVQSREQLGLFHRGWPHVIKVINKAQRDHESQKKRVTEQIYHELLQQARKRLEELKEEMQDVAKFSTFNQKKTPLAVFNYLTSLIEKHFDIVPEQMVLYTILCQFREDELFQCLFNISIYLGTIDQPEALIAELKEIYATRQTNSQITTDELLSTGAKLSKKERRKINSMIEQKSLLSPTSSSNAEIDEEETTPAAPIDPRFAGPISVSRSKKPPPPTSFKELCSEIYATLEPYDTILTIEQLVEIEGEICAGYGVANFSIFSYDDDDDDDGRSGNLVSFLAKHRHDIDPYEELSIYQHTVSSIHSTELYPFIEQLNILHNDAVHEEHIQHHVTSSDRYGSFPRLNISTEKLTAVEKAVKYKFGGSIGARIGSHMISKAKQRYQAHQSSIVRFEESLLDIHGLDRLEVCPHSLNVDETKLCNLILNCPLMIDLYQYFQWLDFFQPKYGPLKSFIHKHKQEFRELRLLETSNRELFRLPSRATLNTFQQELKSVHIRSAVGHLCALIVQEGSVTQISFNVYRTSMISWFRELRSKSSSQDGSMQCILDFLIYLPKLIGQSRIVEELVIRPLDDVFGNERMDGMNARKRIWNLADAKQRTKLELWGHRVDIPEWQNENKWSGLEELEERSNIRSENITVQVAAPHPVTPSTPTTPVVPSSPIFAPSATTVAPLPVAVDGDLSAQAAFDHIEAIRRGFGVNSGLDSSGQFIVDNLQGMVARSLEKLSVDLFSDQGHFVLELIQNADDNHYTDDRFPTLRFFVSSERVLVCNNEKGFRPEDISAICNVGASTKGKHKQGYVGHKGIGFKSVFMVSHQPEIHSRNYHLRFDTVNGTEKIGYIRPIWLDQYEETLPDSSEWTTSIRLPIKQDTERSRLQRNFNDVQAKLLLFLNRLRQIEIINEPEGTSNTHHKRIFTRTDHAQVQIIDDSQGQIIELREKATDKPPVANLWLVVKKVINVPNHIKTKLLDTKGEVNSTTIAITYCLSDIEDSSNRMPPAQPLFAYLPLRSYGFRFILQADFEIPATRQEIRQDSLWNDWLRSEMACLLPLAYRHFQRLPDLLASGEINSEIHPRVNPMQMVKYFLKLIPSRSEASPYFNSFVDESIKLLMGIIELPVARQNENNESIIEWVSPSRCIFVKDDLIRKILSQDVLLSHFNCYYVHEELTKECDEQILLKLGCRLLEFKDITQLIESSYKQDEQRHLKTAASMEQIAQWLLCLDYSLGQERHEAHHFTREKETLARLKQLKMIPLKHETHLVSIEEYEKQGIMLPSAKSAQLSKHLKLVLDDLPTVDEQLLNFIEDKQARQLDSVKRLLQKLDIKETLRIQDIYRRHMLTVMSNPTLWASKPEPILMAYVLCIFEYIYLANRDGLQNDITTLQNTLVIKTRDNKFVSLGSPDLFVHLTSTYSSKTSLESLRLSTYKFTFISDDYFKLVRTQTERQDRNIHPFIAFLRELRITDFLQVNSIDQTFLDVQGLANTKWSYLIGSLSEKIYDPFKIKDLVCEEFNKLVSPSDENQKPDRELCVQLLQYLDVHHEMISPNYVATIILDRADKFGHGTSIQGVPSSFQSSLCQYAWIPVDGDLLCKPDDVYLIQSNSATAPFRRYVPHVDTSNLSLRNGDLTYNILGMKSEIPHKAIFELLMKWSCNLDSESLWNLVNEPKTPEIIPCTLPNTFCQTCLDTIDQFQRIFCFLASDDEISFLLYRFRLWPLIFIPQDRQTGAFVFAHQTFWNDPTSLLASQGLPADSKNRIPILQYYGMVPTLPEFFKQILNVEAQPSIDDYLPLIASIQDIDQIWAIIKRTTTLAIEQNKEEEIQEKYRDMAFIPCLNNPKKFVKYTDHPFYPHDEDIVDLFVGTIPIIKLPDSGLSNELKDQFCSLFNIESLDQVIQTKIKVENEEPSTILTEFYRSCIDLIQHFLLSKKLISVDRSNHLSTILSSMRFLCVDQIDLSYCYGDIVKTPTSHRLDTYVEEETRKFYILKKFEQSDMRVTKPMTHFLTKDELAQPKLLQYIQDLLQVYQKDGTKGFDTEREKITENYQPKWTIPEEKKKDLPVTSSVTDKVEESVLETPVVTQEMIDAMKEEVSVRSQLPPRPQTNENPNPPSTVLPALNLINDPSKPKSNDPTASDHTTTPSIFPGNDPTDSNRTAATVSTTTQERNADNQDHQVPEGDRRERDENSIPKNTFGDFVDKDPTDRKPNKDGMASGPGRTSSNRGPLIIEDSDPLPAPILEEISVATLANFDLSTSAMPAIDLSTDVPLQSLDPETDAITGRQGEALIFRYLKQTHPQAEIKWMNEEKESYAPYDISMKTNSEDEYEEFIEVKTTRSIDQYTFPISIGEVQWLLKHSSNYFIYRVYYADPVQSSTITKISRVRENLKWKHIKLRMTIPSQSNN